MFHSHSVHLKDPSFCLRFIRLQSLSHEYMRSQLDIDDVRYWTLAQKPACEKVVIFELRRLDTLLEDSINRPPSFLTGSTDTDETFDSTDSTDDTDTTGTESDEV